MSDTPEKVDRELLEILEEAITEEQNSAQRYQRGAELATEGEVKAMFEKLAADEVIHEQVLRKRYYEIKKRLGLKVFKEE